MNVYYLCRYVDSENKQNRKVFLSAVNKIDYIIDCIINAGNTVTVVSFADSADAENKKGEFKQLKDGLFLKTFFSLGNKNVFARVIGRSLLKLSYLLYLIKTVKPGDVVLAYHSPFYLSSLKLLKKIRHCKIISEFEEVYADLSGSSRLRKKELNFCKCVDAFVFPTELLNNAVNTLNKPYVTVHGIYKSQEKLSDKHNDGKTHCVYAGIFDKRKGCLTAVESAQYLDEKYHLHILGFGTPEQVAELKTQISLTKQKTKCVITYDGCLSGKEYVEFLQKCHIGLSPQDVDAGFNSTSFPSKILSYMSNGLKVVSVRIPAIESSAVAKELFFYDEQTPECIAKTIKMATDVCNYDARQILSEFDEEFKKSIESLLGAV